MLIPLPEATPCRIPGAPEDLCLSFANTRYWRGSPAPTETLTGPHDLLHWCAGEGRADPALVAAIQARWAEAKDEAAKGLDLALAWREAIFAVFAATARGAAPAEVDLDLLNEALEAAPGRHRLVREAAGWRWILPAPTPGPAALLAPALWSAGDLLAGGRLGRVRQCANERCLWLFLDDSKSGTRRWCSMASCGNRAKAHRHYARKREK